MQANFPRGIASRFACKQAPTRMSITAVAEVSALQLFVHRLAITHERRFDHLGGLALVADFHIHLAGGAGGQPGQGDGFAQRRRKRAAGNLALLAIGQQDLLVGAQYARPTSSPWPCCCWLSSGWRPTKSRSLRTRVHPMLASQGVMLSSMSLPYRFMPASRRRVSRAPRPMGATPASSNCSHSFTASAPGSMISTPSSPV